jgi:hypothetical protein
MDTKKPDQPTEPGQSSAASTTPTSKVGSGARKVGTGARKIGAGLRKVGAGYRAIG